ncbi:hypothetical protein Tco_0411576 [Tanacetum coccineum]
MVVTDLPLITRGLTKTIIPTTAPETTVIPPITTTTTLIIPTTLPFQSPFLSSPPKTTPQPEGEQIKKEKGKKASSHEETDEEESASNSETKFPYDEEEIRKQKEIKQSVKADVAKAKIKKGKKELIDLLGLELVEKMYKDKVKYDKYCNKMLNRRAQGKITKSTKRYKTSVQFADHQAETVLNEPSLGRILFSSRQRQDFVSIKYFDDMDNEMLYNVQKIFFRLHKWPGTNDLARTFSTFLVVEVEKRNLNPSKQIRLIDSSTSVLQVLRRSSSIVTSVYVTVQKLKKTLARASVQLGWEYQAE